MGTDKRVQILLSTYNGEKYLREQLDSFLRQTYYDIIKVLIRDDGSTDGTRDILLEYKEKYGFELIFGENIGCNKSVLYLFEHSDRSCEYFAISDQDDVWFDDKIETAVKMLDKHKSDSEPVMFSSLSCVTDESLKPIGHSVAPSKGVGFYNACVQNVCPGHTQVVNRRMVELLTECIGCDGIFVIDYWNYILASAFGTVLFEKNSTIYHRQHSGNALGYATNFFTSTINRIKRLSFSKPDSSAVQLAAFLNLYRSKLKEEYLKEAESFFISQKSFLKRLKYAFSMKFYRQSFGENVIFRFLYILGKYHL